MTNSLRIAGGILSVIGGGFILIDVLTTINDLPSIPYERWPPFFLALSIAILALVGGIIVLSSALSGGIIVLVAGILAFTFGIIYFTTSVVYFRIWPYSVIETIFDEIGLDHLDFIFGIPFEAFLILTGGILAEVGKKSA